VTFAWLAAAVGPGRVGMAIVMSSSRISIRDVGSAIGGSQSVDEGYERNHKCYPADEHHRSLSAYFRIFAVLADDQVIAPHIADVT